MCSQKFESSMTPGYFQSIGFSTMPFETLGKSFSFGVVLSDLGISVYLIKKLCCHHLTL